MLLNLIDKMHEKNFCEWKFEYFLAFVVINIMAWGGCLATVVTLISFSLQKGPFQYILYAAGSAILGISAFAYIISGKDGW